MMPFFSRALNFLRLWLFIGLLGASVTIHAGVPTILTVVIATPSILNSEFVDHLKSELRPHLLNGAKLNVVYLDQLSKQKLPETDGHVLIALGVQALSELSQLDTKLPIFGVFVPQLSYESIWSQSKRSQDKFSAILLDQPFARQLSLMRNVLPNAERVGVLYGPTSKRLSDALNKEATKQNLTLAEQELAQSSELMLKLKLVLEDSEVLLAVPDPSIYSRETAQTILLTSYRYQKPVLGFSQAYVKAGALAAVYSSPAQIAKQTAEVIMQPQTAFPPPRYPKYFSVDINRQVARSLNIDLQDENALSEALLKIERQAP